MRVRVKYYVAGLTILALAMPMQAHTYKESLTFSNNTTIGSAQLKPGSYELTGR
jgi:hypothetical protein